MKISDIISEAPLPPDFDQSSLDKSYKARKEAFINRFKKVGTGSSRTVFEYDDPKLGHTVFKLAHNEKGLAQNQVEAEVFDDSSYNTSVVIPLLDSDPDLRWIQVPYTKPLRTSAQLTKALKLPVDAYYVFKYFYEMNNTGDPFTPLTDEQLAQAESNPTVMNVVDMMLTYDLLHGDLSRGSAWGIYQGEPRIIDAGLTRYVYNTYYRRKGERSM